MVKRHPFLKKQGHKKNIAVKDSITPECFSQMVIFIKICMASHDIRNSGREDVVPGTMYESFFYSLRTFW
jgi:hypothetical protein